MRKWIAASLLAATCTLLAGGVRAQGCPGVVPWVFDDVAVSDPFCPFVTEMARRGLTAGCAVINANHRLFCPDTLSTRMQIAAFIARLGPDIRVNAVRPGNWSSGVSAVLVPLDAAGNLTLDWFQASAMQRILTYSAECSVDAPVNNNFAWLDIDIVVNSDAVPPTAGTSEAFCSADGIAGFGGYGRHSITVVIDTVAGQNTVSIRARGNAGATGIWLGDSALIIH
jgi:hypothetical protein